MDELVSAFRWAGTWLLLVSAVGCGDVELHNEGRRTRPVASAASAATTTPASEQAGPARRVETASAGSAGTADDDARDADEDARDADDEGDAEGEAGRGAEGDTARAAGPRARTPNPRAGTGTREPAGRVGAAASSVVGAAGARARRTEATANPARSARVAQVEPTRADDDAAATNEGDVEASQSASDGLRVRSVVVSRGVANRLPVGQGTTFGANDGTPVYTYVEAENTGTEPATLVFSWRREGGRAVGGQRIEVPASTRRWRTWALTRNARTAGEWTAEVRTADGRLIGSRRFVIEP